MILSNPLLEYGIDSKNCELLTVNLRYLAGHSPGELVDPGRPAEDRRQLAGYLILDVGSFVRQHTSTWLETIVSH